MKKIRKERCAAILEADPGRFAERYNALMDQLTESGAELDKPEPYRTGDGYFCAVITFREIHKEYETVKEEYQDRGEVYFCTDCPEYQKQADGRRKGGQCKYKNFIAQGATACNGFYKRLALGEIEPKE